MRDQGHHESMALKATEAETVVLLCSDMIRRRMITDDDAVEVHFDLRLRYLTGLQTTLIVIIVLDPMLTRPRNCWTCGVDQVIKTTAKMPLWSG